MNTSKESRKAFYKAARKQIDTLKKHPRLKRKHLMPLISFLFEGMLMITEDREPGDGKDSKA